jgi:hypothetical protein
MHDPSLRRLGREPQFSEDRRERHESAFGFSACLAHHQVIRETDERSTSTRLPCPVKPV